MLMLAAQQSHKMKQVIAEMDSSTAYVVFDFKQKFLAKGFREGGDSYYGKKGMLWFGVGVYIKPDSQHASYSESPDKLHVEMDFTADVIRLQQEAEMAESVCDRQDEHVDEQEDEDVQSRSPILSQSWSESAISHSSDSFMPCLFTEYPYGFRRSQLHWCYCSIEQ